MKKLGILIATALVLGFTSCEDEISGVPQTNPQEPVMSADAVTVALPEATAQAVNLGKYNTDEGNGLIPVLEIKDLVDFPDYYELKGVMEYGVDANYAKSKNLDLVYQDNVMYVPVDAWESAHLELYSKNPRDTKSYVRFALYALNGTTQVRLGDNDNPYFADHEVTVTPFPAAIVVEDGYKLIGDVEGQMNPTNSADVYDPPTFSYKMEVPEGQTIKVQVVSNSGVVYGQDPAQKDALAVDGAPLEISQVGPVLLTVNMEELTWSISLAIPEIYAYGSSATSGYTLTTNNFIDYSGYYGLRSASQGVRFANQKVLKPTMVWGQAMDDAENAIEGQIMLQTDGATPIKLGDKGCYFLNVNLLSLIYTSYPVEYFSLIGGWDGWSADVKLTPTDKNFMVWQGSLAITDGTSFKIRTNGDWEGPDLGIANDFTGTGYFELQDHGGDITWNLGDGTFDVTLDLTKVPYTLTAVKK